MALRRIAFASLLLIGMAVFAIYIWPTRYRPLSIRDAARVFAAREDRFTGEVQFLVPGRATWGPLIRVDPRDVYQQQP